MEFTCELHTESSPWKNKPGVAEEHVKLIQAIAGKAACYEEKGAAGSRKEDINDASC